MFDNALIAAGLLDDPRAMTPRLNAILLKNLELLQHDMPSGGDDANSSNSENLPKEEEEENSNFEQQKN